MKTKTVEQTVKFKGVKPAELYNMFLSSKHHGTFVNGKVKTSKKVGDSFSIWDGMLTGKNLMLKPGDMIVQSWRAKDWKKKDDDSVLILHFEKIPGGAELHLVHAHIPARDAKDLDNGWRDHYWKPWKKYIRDMKKKK